jgi:small-conductance mechanosensitive channel
MMPAGPPEGEKPGTAKPATGRAPGKPRTVPEKREAVQRDIEAEQATGLRRLYLTFMHQYSPYRSILLALVTLVVLLVIKGYTTRLVRRYADERAHKGENVKRFLRTWHSLWKFVIGVMVIIALSGSLQLLGLSAAFLGMMLGWSLQAPVTGLAAWLMIVLKRPFRIGDRVIIAGIIGDVTDITLTHVVLNQVGGTVGGEEPSGRAVLIPNAILFNQVIMNYTLDAQYMLDEVPVRLTFDSDYELARRLMLDAAREATADIIEATGQEPFIRCEFFDAGVLVRLRYQSVPARRQELSSAIVERVLRGFKEHYPAVKYCFPHSVVRYRWEQEESST